MFHALSFTNIFFIYVVLIWFMFHSRLSDAHQEKHFLHYKFTVLTKADTFPEFSAVIVADGRQIKHFSDEERVWILTEDDWTEPPKDPPDSRDWFIHQIRTLTNCTNSQCSELHVLQRIIGCELEKLPDGTVNLTVFDEYGFDGEDFISFNSDTMKWIDKNPKAKETKEKWDLQTERNQFIKYFLKTYMNWISTFNNTKQSSPDVHVFARKAPDDDSNLVLTCLATGFYPRDVQMNIRLYRTKLKHQTSSGIRPNDDETFQMRISVKINRNHKGSYDCLVIHNSLRKPVTVKWEKHFLHYKFTALSKADTFPEFSAVGVCEDRQIKHFSDEERVWILTEDDWTEPPDPPDSRDWFIHQIRTLTNCTNSQCSELHVLQRIIGCELEKLPDGTVNLTVFDEYGFDGEDFISFNSDTMKWIDKNPKAKETKEKWDLHTERNKFLKYFLKNCIDWISTYNNTKKSSPDVHVSVRKAPDDDSNLVLTCLATGFYPRDVQMNIRLNRNILEDQTSSGIRPNDDETFQMRISVKINRNHEGSYDCLLIHSSLTEPVSVKWDGACFDCERERFWLYIRGAAPTLLLIVECFIYRWLKNQEIELSNGHGIDFHPDKKCIDQISSLISDISLSSYRNTC
ncbi:hypothetical protein ABG768_012353 [Culter alburnus]|uniref:Ig-like domain-containing protein n=1 Tax=Culter alburnus TaxID=194366 RepID=A0AAW1Z9N4_CULAL